MNRGKNTVFSIVLYGFKAARKRGKCGNLLSRQGSTLGRVFGEQVEKTRVFDGFVWIQGCVVAKTMKTRRKLMLLAAPGCQA